MIMVWLLCKQTSLYSTKKIHANTFQDDTAWYLQLNYKDSYLNRTEREQQCGKKVIIKLCEGYIGKYTILSTFS